MVESCMKLLSSTKRNKALSTQDADAMEQWQDFIEIRWCKIGQCIKNAPLLSQTLLPEWFPRVSQKKTKGNQ